jgi:hypothetical protein
VWRLRVNADIEMDRVQVNGRRIQPAGKLPLVGPTRKGRAGAWKTCQTLARRVWVCGHEGSTEAERKRLLNARSCASHFLIPHVSYYGQL